MPLEAAEMRELEEHIAGLDDLTLLEMLSSMLANPGWSDAHCLAGINENCATTARVLWTEIADRFVPADKVAEAYARVLVDRDDQAALNAEKELLVQDLADRASRFSTLRPAALAVVHDA